MLVGRDLTTNRKSKIGNNVDAVITQETQVMTRFIHT